MESSLTERRVQGNILQADLYLKTDFALEILQDESDGTFWGQSCIGTKINPVKVVFIVWCCQLMLFSCTLPACDLDTLQRSLGQASLQIHLGEVFGLFHWSLYGWKDAVTSINKRQDAENRVKGLTSFTNELKFHSLREGYVSNTPSICDSN